MRRIRRWITRWGIPVGVLMILLSVSFWSVRDLEEEKREARKGQGEALARMLSVEVAARIEEGASRDLLDHLFETSVRSVPGVEAIRYCTLEASRFRIRASSVAGDADGLPARSARAILSGKGSLEDTSGGRFTSIWPVEPACRQQDGWLLVSSQLPAPAASPLRRIHAVACVFLFCVLLAFFIRQQLCFRSELKARKNTEEVLTKKARVDEILARFSRSLLLASTLEEMATYALEGGEMLTGSRIGCAGYLEGGRGNLVCCAWFSETMQPEESPRIVMIQEEGTWETEFDRRRPSLFEGTELHVRFPDGPVPVERKLCIPAMEGDVLLGVITLADFSPDMPGEVIRSLARLADLYALAIRKSLVLSALKDSETRFRVSFQTSPDAMIITRKSDGRIVDVNSGFVDLTGFDRREVLGKRISQLGVWDGEEERMDLQKRADRQGFVRNVEQLFRHRCGRMVTVLVSVAFFQLDGEPHYLSISRDIGEMKATEAELRKERSFLAQVVETSPAGIVAVDRHGQILHANQKCGEILGLSIEEILDRSFYDARWEVGDHDGHPVPADAYVFFRARASAAPLYDVRHSVLNGRGERIYLSINATAIRSVGGELEMMVVALEDMTDRWAAERSLKDARSRIEMVIRNLPVILFALDATGRFSVIEGQGLRVHGVESRDLAGNDVFNRLGSIPEVTALARRALSGEEIAATANIRGREYEINALPIRNEAGQFIGVSGVATDISRRIRAEEEQLRLSAAIEQVAEIILVTNRDGIIEYVNPAFERITGHTREDVTGRTPRILKSGTHGPEFYREMWETLLSGQVWRGYLTNRKKDGTTYDEEANISPIFDRNGEIMNFVAVKRDVSQERSLERQLRQAQKMEAIGTLAGGIAHDFNNILFPIIGFTELALEMAGAENVERRYLESILSAAARARDLVWQILTFSRQTENERTPIQVRPIVKEALKLLRASIPATIEIRHGIEAVGGLVMADPTQIHQVVMNLCANAYQAMEETGGILDVRLREMEVDSDHAATREIREGRYLLLSVGDSGPGMDAATMERIFDPYFTTKEQGKGTGLGLATVHGIVVGCKGEIRVESEWGKGTTFNVYLPVIEQKPRPEARFLPEVEHGAGERILLVDDEAPIVILMQEVLHSLGYEVAGRTSSLEAVAIFEKEPEGFDLVISDLSMPNLDGLELAERLRAIRPEVPIILCSGFSERVTDAHAERLGIVASLMKPVARADLAQVIRRALGRKAA